MFDLVYGTNMNRSTTQYSLSKTPKQALDEFGIDYSTGSVHLDGVTLDNTKMNQSFESLGITTKAVLTVVVKADAAM